MPEKTGHGAIGARHATGPATRTMAADEQAAATPTQPASRGLLWAYGCLLAACLVIYLPEVGHGFIKDDFGWIVSSRPRSVGEVVRLFEETRGFYRPLVSLSFAANEYAFGASPFGYGVTNLLLALAAGLGVAWFGRLSGLQSGASLFAAAVWLLNPHGINMAVLWLSGRTSLLLTLFALLAAIAAAKARPAVAALLCLAALLSKEEAILLPLPLLLILSRGGDPRRRAVLVAAAWLLTVSALYFVLRFHSDAMTPATAPPHYQLTFAPPLVMRNIVEYADRSFAFVAVLVLLVAAVAASRPRLTSAERRLVATGLTWLVAGFGITVFLPVRSSLYACFPSVGSAVVGAAVVSAIWRATTVRRRRLAAVVGVIVLVFLVPVQRQRNRRWVELTDLSAMVTPALRLAAQVASDGHVLIVDDRSTRVSITSTYGSLLPDAVLLASGERRSVWLVPPPDGSPATELVSVPKTFASAWALRHGRLVRIDGATMVGASAVVWR